MKRNLKALAALLCCALALALAACTAGTGTAATEPPATDAGAEATQQPETVVVTDEGTDGGDEATDPTADGGDEATDPTADGGDEATDPATDGSDEATDPATDGGDGATGGGEGLEAPNPLVEYADVSELNAALGFTVLELDADAGYTAAGYTAIGDSIGEIRYASEAGAQLALRTGAGAEDISGVYGAELTEREAGGLTVHSGALEGLLVAWFSDGTTACSLTAEGLAQADFDALVDGLAAALASRAA